MPKSNPEIGGHDVVDLAWEGLGIGLTAVLNDRFASPLARQMVPSSTTSGMTKLIDAITTGITAWAAGMGVGLVSRPVGRKIERGGYVLAVAKGISVIVPGFALSASLPLPGFGAPALPAAKNGNGTNGTNGTAVQTRLGVGSMGL